MNSTSEGEQPEQGGIGKGGLLGDIGRGVSGGIPGWEARALLLHSRLAKELRPNSGK